MLSTVNKNKNEIKIFGISSFKSKTHVKQPHKSHNMHNINVNKSQEPSSYSCLLQSVEKKVMRVSYYLLCNMKKNQAKFLFEIILHGYIFLHEKLPNSVFQKVDSLVDELAKSEPDFVDLWNNLLAESSTLSNQCHPSKSKHQIIENPSPSSTRSYYSDSKQPTLYNRLYENVSHYIRLVMDSHFIGQPLNVFHAQTPMTSPQPNDYYLFQEDSAVEGVHDMIPGWATHYMERDANIPPVIYRRMQEMMHSSIPLKLFRVEVQYDNVTTVKDYNMYGYASPGSFPPTPIGREFQSRRIQSHTLKVLSDANMVLKTMVNNK